jgi:di/tricarboxylate transporter
MVAEFALCCTSFLLFWINVLPASMIRYAVVLFPIFVGLARACAGRPLLLAAVAAGFATINGLLTVAFVMGWRIAV